MIGKLNAGGAVLLSSVIAAPAVVDDVQQPVS